MSSLSNDCMSVYRVPASQGWRCSVLAMVVTLQAAAAFAQCLGEQKLTASDAEADSVFGRPVSVEGDKAVVGAQQDDCAAGTICGSAYVYRFNGTSWIEEQKLTASDAGAADRFGGSVSTSGDLVVVGAWGDDVGAVSGCGSAYVYRFNGTSWVEEQKLTASDAEEGDAFGYSISVTGDTALVGSIGDGCTAGDACGSVYVFRFNGSTWVEAQKLTASDAAAIDAFGVSVSMSGDAALVGAFWDDCAGGSNCGSAYMFRFNGTSWVEEQKLTSSDGASNDTFGTSVSVSGDTAVVGASVDDWAAGEDCGSAYVFRFNGTSWIEERKLTASDAEAGDIFGKSVSVSGDTVVVGANWADCPAGVDCGSAYLFRFDGSDWLEEEKLTASDTAANDLFGVSVSVSGDAVVVGASGADCEAGSDCGAAYFYRCSEPICWEEQKLTAASVAGSYWSGMSVSLSGNRALVGAPGDWGCGLGHACGSASVFRFDGLTWIEEQKLTSSDPAAWDQFGYSVGISGDTAVVGAGGDDCPGVLDSYCGAAYVYRFNGTAWVEAQKLTAADAAEDDYFGCSVSASGDTVLIGASGVDGVEAVNCGSAYVFRFNGTSWVQEQKLTASDAAADDRFGESLSISGDTAVVGAFRDDCVAGEDCGSAYVFRFNGTSWVQEQKLTASDAAAGDVFGFSVSVSGETVLLNARGEYCSLDSNCGVAYVFRFNGTSWVEEQSLNVSNTGPVNLGVASVSVVGSTAVVGASNYGGAAYVFRFNGTQWIEKQKLTAQDQTPDDRFGCSVSTDGEKVVVGANWDDCLVYADCGAAYAFQCTAEETCWLSSASQAERLELPSSPLSQKVRYLSFAGGDSGRSQAIRVSFQNLAAPYGNWNGIRLWVQEPQQYCENAGVAQESPCPAATGGLPQSWFWGAQLGCDPYFTDWTAYDIVHVWNEGIIPSASYDIQVVDDSCSLTAEESYSAALTMTQSVWADLIEDCSTTPCKPPDGSTGIVDVTAILDKWKNLPGNVKKVRADIEGSPAGDHRIPDQSINITDVTYCLGAYMGQTYPPPGFPAPSDPPVCP